jgi:hypothetical protein
VRNQIHEIWDESKSRDKREKYRSYHSLILDTECSVRAEVVAMQQGIPIPPFGRHHVGVTKRENREPSTRTASLVRLVVESVGGGEGAKMPKFGVLPISCHSSR